MEMVDSFKMAETATGISTTRNDLVVAYSTGVFMYIRGKMKKKLTGLGNHVCGVTVTAQGLILLAKPDGMESEKCSQCPENIITVCTAICMQPRSVVYQKKLYIRSVCANNHKQDEDEAYLNMDEVIRCCIVDIIVTHDFHTAVCDVGNKCVHVFCDDIYLRKITLRSPNKKNTFRYPQAITSSSENHLIVSDSQARCVKVFDIDGNFFRKIGRKVHGGFIPAGICTDAWDRIIVADTKNHRILMFNLRGNLLSVILDSESEGTLETQPSLVSTFMDQDSRDMLVVYYESTEGHEVRIYSGLSDQPFTSPESYDSDSAASIGSSVFSFSSIDGESLAYYGQASTSDVKPERLMGTYRTSSACCVCL